MFIFRGGLRVGGKHPQGLLLSLRGRSQRGLPKPLPPARRRRLSRAGGGGLVRARRGRGGERASGDPGYGRRARPDRPPHPSPRPAASCGGRRCASWNRWSHTETSKSCRRRPAPARSRRPDPSSHPTERQTRRVPDLSCPACSESVMFGQERGGAGGQVWRPAAAAAAAGRGEDPCAACGHLFPAAADR